jgi:hypothetical protein
VEAGYLRSGDHIATADAGGWATVQSLRGPPGKETVYNFVVAATHTFFVGSGATWVHNGGPCNTIRLWRAVEPEELKDVLRYGDYDIHPNSTFKRFAFDEKSLDNFIRANPELEYTKTYIDISKDKIKFMTRHEDARGVGKAIGIDVYLTPEFYEWFDKVHIIR